MSFNEVDDKDCQDGRLIREPSPYGAAKKSQDRLFTVEDIDAMPDYPIVELIDGVIFTLGEPTIKHQDVVAEMLFQTMSYIRNNNGDCKCLVSPIGVCLDPADDETIVQPDFLVVCDTKKTETGKKIYGAPDWIVEVLSPSTRKWDMNQKLDKYRETGVREYWMVDLESDTVIVNDFTKGNIARIISMNEPLPVGIYDGELKIDLSEFTDTAM